MHLKDTAKGAAAVTETSTGALQPRHTAEALNLLRATGSGARRVAQIALASEDESIICNPLNGRKVKEMRADRRSARRRP